ERGEPIGRERFPSPESRLGIRAACGRRAEETVSSPANRFARTTGGDRRDLHGCWSRQGTRPLQQVAVLDAIEHSDPLKPAPNHRESAFLSPAALIAARC